MFPRGIKRDHRAEMGWWSVTISVLSDKGFGNTYSSRCHGYVNQFKKKIEQLFV